jgi:hypothetical protein
VEWIREGAMQTETFQHPSERRSQTDSLREQLRRDFPAEVGFEVDEAVRIEVVDGKEELIPLTIVTGNGVDMTFFSPTPK